MEDNLNTAYDDAFRTMITKCDDLVFALLNYMFGENYTGEEVIVRNANEELIQQDGGGIRKRITDAQLKVGTPRGQKKYHIECESSNKLGMVLVRIFEYGAQMALGESELQKESMTLQVQFPNAGALLLRGNKDTPKELTIRISVPGGDCCSYQVPVVWVKEITLEQIFGEKLYFLLPFYIFRYEKELPILNADEEKLSLLLKEYESITDRLDALVEIGSLSSRSRYVIIQMIKRVSDKLTEKQEQVKRKVGDLMGGHVIDLDIFQAEDRAEARGKAMGAEQQLIKMICRKLRKGKDAEQIADELEEDEIRVKVICDAAAEYAPDYDEERVLAAVRLLTR